jgi:hypothetical protein
LENLITRFSTSASRNWGPMGLFPVRQETSTRAILGYSLLQGLLTKLASFPRLFSRNRTRRLTKSICGGQISKQIRHVRPFFRYQYVNASSNNTIYDDVGLREGPSFGARYDLNNYIAFKAQSNNTVRRGEPDLNGLQLQLAFTF